MNNLSTFVKRSFLWLGCFFAATSALALDVGNVAPDFSLKNQDGKVVTLSEFKGKPVLLYFYPKDDTPGCTTEACSLRDAYEKYQKVGAVILGVSAQGEKSHQAFRAKHKLPFDLLVDANGKTASKYGVGHIMGFFQRKSVLIGADGKVLRMYNSVNPEEHAAEVLKDIQASQGVATGKS